ncbi:hypothetical protein KUTeg_013859, partial [Tegillarca granosa]
MVKTCCVYKCNNQYNAAAKVKGVSFFRFPKDQRKRRAWIKAINRRDWLPNDHSWICSEHFIDGWHGEEPTDNNYAPTIFAYKSATPSASQIERESRHRCRDISKEQLDKATQDQQREQLNKSFSLFAHSDYCTQEQEWEEAVPTTTSADDCEPDPLLVENIALRREVKQLKEELRKHKWSVEKISDNDSATKFYTGLPTFAVFVWLFQYLESKSSRMTYWTGESSTPSGDRLETMLIYACDLMFSPMGN